MELPVENSPCADEFLNSADLVRRNKCLPISHIVKVKRGALLADFAGFGGKSSSRLKQEPMENLIEEVILNAEEDYSLQQQIHFMQQGHAPDLVPINSGHSIKKNWIPDGQEASFQRDIDQLC